MGPSCRMSSDGRKWLTIDEKEAESQICVARISLDFWWLCASKNYIQDYWKKTVSKICPKQSRRYIFVQILFLYFHGCWLYSLEHLQKLKILHSWHVNMSKPPSWSARPYTRLWIITPSARRHPLHCSFMALLECTVQKLRDCILCTVDCTQSTMLIETEPHLWAGGCISWNNSTKMSR